MISDCERFEVRRIFFRYEEDPAKGKNRPVVVALIDREQEEAVVLKVTGHAPRAGYPGEVALLDWEQEGLSKPSTVRCAKMARVSLPYLLSSDIYGYLSNRDGLRVRSALIDLGVI